MIKNTLIGYGYLLIIFINHIENNAIKITPKNEKLESEIDLLKTEILELTKTRTLKIPTYPTIMEESDDKLIKVQDSDKNNNLGINTNNTSSTTNNQKDNIEKKPEEEKDKEKGNTNTNPTIEITPDNYDLIKIIKLN